MLVFVTDCESGCTSVPLCNLLHEVSALLLAWPAPCPKFFPSWFAWQTSAWVVLPWFLLPGSAAAHSCLLLKLPASHSNSQQSASFLHSTLSWSIVSASLRFLRNACQFYLQECDITNIFQLFRYILACHHIHFRGRNYSRLPYLWSRWH